MVNGGKEVTAVQTEASKEINSIFPDSLRSPVLRYVQFRTTARMDDLGKFDADSKHETLLTCPPVNNVFDVRLACCSTTRAHHTDSNTALQRTVHGW